MSKDKLFAVLTMCLSASILLILAGVLYWFYPHQEKVHSDTSQQSTPVIKPSTLQIHQNTMSQSTVFQTSQAAITASEPVSVSIDEKRIIDNIDHVRSNRYTTTSEKLSFLRQSLVAYKDSPSIQMHILDLLAMIPNIDNIASIMPLIHNTNSDIVEHALSALSNQVSEIDDALQKDSKLSFEEITRLQGIKANIASDINIIYQNPKIPDTIKNLIVENYNTTNNNPSDLLVMSDNITRKSQLSDNELIFMQEVLVNNPVAPTNDILAQIRKLPQTQQQVIKEAVKDQIEISKDSGFYMSDDRKRLLDNFIEN